MFVISSSINVSHGNDLSVFHWNISDVWPYWTLLNSVFLQRIKEERVKQLALSSFKSDLQIKRELDKIAVITGTDRCHKDIILEFLRKSGCVTDEISAVPVGSSCHHGS